MDAGLIILIVIFLGFPVLFFPAAIFYLRSDGFKRRFPDALYQIFFLVKKWNISKHLLVHIAVLSLLFIWLDIVFPPIFSLAVVFFAIMSLKVVKVKKFDVHATAESSDVLLKRLKDIQFDIVSIRQHIEGLHSHITFKQVELDEKEKLRKQLEKDIEKKSSIASQLETLTQDQKRLVLDAAIAAMSKKSKRTFWFGLILGFFINILAILTWTLIGNPEKEQIIDNLKNIINLFK